MAPTLATDPRTAPVLDALRQALGAAYGPRLQRTVLYGSRARGDAGPESDWDIAVFLEPAGDRGAELIRLADIGTALLEAHGAVVHAVPFAAADLAKRTPLMHEIRKDGVTLWRRRPRPSSPRHGRCWPRQR